jgi:signal transduction histidine kinase
MHDHAFETTVPALGSRGRLSAPRLVRAIAVLAIVGGIFTLLSIAAPHIDRRYDAEFLGIGGVLIVVGACLLALDHLLTVGLRTVHAATLLISLIILVLAWLNMRDLGGVQAVFLILLLGISASVGPAWWSGVLFVLQSVGYAIVLATADLSGGFDPFSQWLVVTMGLATCLAYNGMLRRELAAGAVQDEARRAERDRERELHAERLERLNEELQVASDLKSNFVAMASHELRTPLTAIEGFAGTLQHRWDDLDDADKRSFVEVIDAQAQRLGRLVGDLLTLSRIESGRLQAQPAAVPVHDVVQRTVRELGDVEVAIDCPPELEVRTDPDHLQQVLLNFLSNARAYGAAPIALTAHEDDRWVEIVVSDHGPGVDPEFVPQLFDRFARAPVAERHDGSSGTGLGLSIVEGLAEANGGSVWYEPNEPTGARFGVRLPREAG